MYDDWKIKICESKTPDEHNVLVGEYYCYLTRGILRDLSEDDAEIFESKLYNVNSTFLKQVKDSRVPIDYLGGLLQKQE